MCINAPDSLPNSTKCVGVRGCLWQQSSSRFSSGGKLQMRMQMRDRMQSPRAHPSGKDTSSHSECQKTEGRGWLVWAKVGVDEGQEAAKICHITVIFFG